MNQEYKSIVDDAAKLQNEPEFKLIKKWLKTKKCSIIMKHSRMLEQTLKTPATYYGN